jgi:hypothetical protein
VPLNGAASANFGAEGVIGPTGVTLPVLQVQKVARLEVDNNGNGLVDPGDTLAYEIMIRNTTPPIVGTLPMVDMALVDTPDTLTRLVAGSVQVTMGTVSKGNNEGEVEVGVTLPPLFGGEEMTIRFLVQVAASLPAGGAAVTNQAWVRGDQLAPVPSDDPATAAPDDATVTAVVAPVLSLPWKVHLPVVDR